MLMTTAGHLQIIDANHVHFQKCLSSSKLVFLHSEQWKCATCFMTFLWNCKVYCFILFSFIRALIDRYRTIFCLKGIAIIIIKQGVADILEKSLLQLAPDQASILFAFVVPQLGKGVLQFFQLSLSLVFDSKSLHHHFLGLGLGYEVRLQVRWILRNDYGPSVLLHFLNVTRPIPLRFADLSPISAMS